MNKRIFVISLVVVMALALTGVSAAPNSGEGQVQVILKDAPKLTAGTRVEYEFDMVRSNYERDFIEKFDPDKPLIVTLPEGSYELNISYDVGRADYESRDLHIDVVAGETVTITIDKFRLD